MAAATLMNSGHLGAAGYHAVRGDRSGHDRGLYDGRWRVCYVADFRGGAAFRYESAGLGGSGS